MIRSELNNNWIQTILYYCYQINSSLHNINGLDVGSWGYDENNDLIIVSWFLSFQEPSINDLLSFDLVNVSNFYSLYYFYPNSINSQQPFFNISTSLLESIPTSLCTKGFCIYDTTTQSVKSFDGTSWVNL